MSYLSECCGAEPHRLYYFDDDMGICGACSEHAHFEEWQEGADPEMEHWEKVTAWHERFSGD